MAHVHNHSSSHTSHIHIKTAMYKCIIFHASINLIFSSFLFSAFPPTIDHPIILIIKHLAFFLPFSHSTYPPTLPPLLPSKSEKSCIQTPSLPVFLPPFHSIPHPALIQKQSVRAQTTNCSKNTRRSHSIASHLLLPSFLLTHPPHAPPPMKMQKREKAYAKPENALC